MSSQEARRCQCGVKLNSFNTDSMCGSCDRARIDSYVASMEQRAREMPLDDVPSDRCRKCDEKICAKSALTNAPRWRQLCTEHYEEQRARSASSMRSWRMSAQR